MPVAQVAAGRAVKEATHFHQNAAETAKMAVRIHRKEAPCLGLHEKGRTQRDLYHLQCQLGQAGLHTGQSEEM
jgi:hypothetical protein